MLKFYQPYPRQAEFHAAGKLYRERLLMAGNQVGKTMSAAAEVAMHATGRYPDWWQGRVFDRPVNAWVAGVTGESTRDNPQRWLYGRIGAPGTGMIPADAIADHSMSRGLADALDTLTVRHGGGGDVQAGTSRVGFKAYVQGREKWQGPTLDFVWFDEEPPEDIYSEGLTRTNIGLCPVILTFTPLLGMSNVVKRFLIDKVAGANVTSMTIDDALHYSPADRAAIVASYPEHEREARAKGIPTMGSGRVFPVAESEITVAPFAIPRHYARLVGGDFGWNHPSAWVWGAHDRDTDIVYVTAVYRCKETLIPVQASAIKARGAWIPVAWPHDGYQVRDAMHGEQLAQQYRNEGVNMRPEHAHFEDTQAVDEMKKSRISTEAGVQEMLTRMSTGRLKVFSNCLEWFEEFRMYHRKEGLLVKEGDDLMSASRVLIMDLRHAITEPRHRGGIDHERRSPAWV